MATVRPDDFAAPGPGVWRFDATRFPHPMSRIAEEVLCPAMAAGTAIAAERYGALAGEMLIRAVLRFRYTYVPPLIPRPAGDDDVAHAAFDRTIQERPDVRDRIAAAQRALDARLWLDDMRRWDSEEKPSAIAGTLALAAVDVTGLDVPGLATHVADALDHLAAATTRHHSFNSTWTIPLGLFLTRGTEWTGMNGGQLLGLLEGASPISAGQTPELEAFAAALRNDPAALQLLESGGEPTAVIAGLRALPGTSGTAARGFLDLHGFACVGGFDPVETYALERPETVIASIRAAVGREPTPPADIARVEEATAATRLLVPAEHREAFDVVLADARQCYRIKDERGLYNDFPARGLVHRAIVEVGRRLRATGRLGEAEHALEAGPAELQELLVGRGPSAEELQARYAYRIDNSDATPPATLGTPDASMVPSAWLPEAVRRVQRATGAALQAMGGGPAPEPQAATPLTLRGVAASRGVYEGPTRIVTSPADFARIEQGDVLVALATTPAISAWLPLLGAIVTDLGGPLSHAAIVAREFGLPAVVGTDSATRTFRDGQRVRVDGAAGTVEPLD